MLKIRIISLIFAIFIVNNDIKANNIDYDDIYKIILSGNQEKAYTLLLAYQKQDPEFANTYFQLALIAKKWAKEFNPFTEFAYTKLFIYNTKLYFNLAKLKLKDEKKKNRIYYENAGIKTGEKKLSFGDISSFIDTKTDEIKLYEDNIIQIVQYLNKSSDFYNECVNIFMNINSEYSKIKNIYLAEEKGFLSEINLLESNFDSTLIYFRKYKDATNTYPIQGYNQNYKLKEIITYRLDGLTNSNFLNNEFTLWNYKKWVEDVKKTKNERIKNNRNDIVSIETEMKNIIQQLSKDEYTDNYKPYKLNDKFIYKIEKYDNNSLLIKLFNLNEAKINYLTFFRKTINKPKISNKYSLLNKASYYYNLYEKRLLFDSLNTEFLANIKAPKIKKYKNFYLSYYNGLQGMKDYSLRQEIFITAKQKEANENLKQKLLSSFYGSSSNFLTYKDQKLIIKKVYPDLKNQTKDKYYTYDLKTQGENNIWLSGSYKTKDNKIQGFAAFSEDKKTIKFIKKSQKSDTSEIITMLTDAFSDGSFFLETSIGNKIKNTLIKYSNKGVLLSKTEIPFSKIPRYMKYDEINNSIFIVLNGNKIDITNSEKEQIIYHINFDDESKTYTIKYNAKAYPFDMIKINNKFLLLSNFVEYIDTDNKKVMSLYKNSFFGIKAVKINSNLINILGFKTNFINKNFNALKTEQLLNLYLNSDVEVVYSAWHD